MDTSTTNVNGSAKLLDKHFNEKDYFRILVIKSSIHVLDFNVGLLYLYIVVQIFYRRYTDQLPAAVGACLKLAKLRVSRKKLTTTVEVTKADSSYRSDIDCDDEVYED